MKTISILAAAVALFSVTLDAQAAGPCDPDPKESATYWQQWAKIVKATGCAMAKAGSDGSFSFPACMDEPSKYEEALEKMVASLGQGEEDSSRRGARHIKFNDSQRGRVNGEDGPTFRSAAPLRSQAMDVTVTPTSGTGKVRLVLCSEDQAGKRTKLGQFVMDLSKGAGKLFSKQFKGVRNQVVHMRVQGDNAEAKGEFTVMFEARKDGK
jgi:hypothetical protein